MKNIIEMIKKIKWRHVEKGAILLGIAGINLIGLLQIFGEHFPPMKEFKAEREIEKIKVCENKEYVESVLGIPLTSSDVLLKDEKNDKIQKQVEKAIYIKEHYILVNYYVDDGTLAGYILISRDESFHPKLYIEKKVFDISNQSFSQLTKAPIIAKSSMLNSRVDCSAYYLELYHHHLATNNCYVGSGISILGYNNRLYFERLNKKVDDLPKQYVKCTENEPPLFSEEKPNVFLIFDCDSIDVDNLLKNELRYELGLSLMDLRKLTN